MVPTNTKALHQLLDLSAVQFPDKVAVEESQSGSVRYGELARLSNRVRDRLRQMSVKPGDRVGICLRKSADAVASLFGIMKAGAAYVPVDPTAPASRNAFIFCNCAVKTVIVEARLAEGLRQEFNQSGSAPELIVLDGIGAGAPLTLALDRLENAKPATSVPSASPDPRSGAIGLNWARSRWRCIGTRRSKRRLC
jgi:acyl-CoA synthetase (AMP-forming)/AMP-acid ligase II